jgi:hypothetical protein
LHLWLAAPKIALTMRLRTPAKPRTTAVEAITIRSAYPEDELVLRRLATLDSSEVPAGPLLLAEADGELRAALSLSDGSAIGDPFFPTLGLIELLRTHAVATVPARVPRRRYRLLYA